NVINHLHLGRQLHLHSHCFHRFVSRCSFPVYHLSLFHYIFLLLSSFFLEILGYLLFRLSFLPSVHETVGFLIRLMFVPTFLGFVIIPSFFSEKRGHSSNVCTVFLVLL